MGNMNIYICVQYVIYFLKIPKDSNELIYSIIFSTVYKSALTATLFFSRCACYFLGSLRKEIEIERTSLFHKNVFLSLFDWMALRDAPFSLATTPVHHSRTQALHWSGASDRGCWLCRSRRSAPVTSKALPPTFQHLGGDFTQSLLLGAGHGGEKDL